MERGRESKKGDSFHRFHLQVFLEVCGDGSISLMETPQLSSLADIKLKKVLKNPSLWCCLCGSQFTLENDLIEHLSYHEKGSSLSCCRCDFATEAPEEMSKHLKRDHSHIYGKDTKRSYGCLLCQFRCNSRRRMEIHVDCHYEEKKKDKRYECQVCSKSYNSHASLRKHKKTHAGVRPHVCGLCGVSFVFRSYLNSHLKTHESEKAYHCRYCSAQFIFRHILTRHERTHTGEKPYRCTLCDHRSARTDGLNNHYLNVHSDFKPYECGTCSAKFPTKFRLYRHSATHLRNKTFICRECEKGFKSIDTLKYHCKYYGHHPAENELPV